MNNIILTTFLGLAMLSNIGVSSCDRNVVVFYKYEFEKCIEDKDFHFHEGFVFGEYRYEDSLNDIECPNMSRFTLFDKDKNRNDLTMPKYKENPYIRADLKNDKTCGVDIVFALPKRTKKPFEYTKMFANNSIKAIANMKNVKIQNEEVQPLLLESKKAFLEHCLKN